MTNDFTKYANTNEILVTRDKAKIKRLMKWMAKTANETGKTVSVNLQYSKSEPVNSFAAMPVSKDFVIC